MRYTGTHRTTYTYSNPVTLGPHKVRLYPRSDPGQYLRSFSISFDPEPDGTTEALDAWGNNVIWAWFSGLHDRLEITTHFDVDRLRLNPFDYIIPTTEGSWLPPVYAADDFEALAPYFYTQATPEVRAFADEVAQSASGRVVDFAAMLSDRIYNSCRMIVRPEGAPWTSDYTLQAGEGSCRDLAVLFIDACRHVGIASRFVSGYVAKRLPGEPRELHAWAGVYFRGAGWRGFDPTQGLAVSTGHVVLATAATPAGAAPVTGTFTDNGAFATLDAEVQFNIVPRADEVSGTLSVG